MSISNQDAVSLKRGEEENVKGGEEEKNDEKKNEKKEDEVKEEEEDEEEEEEEEQYAIIPPNGGWGWFVVFCAFYCNLVVDGIQLTFGVFLKTISENLKVDYAQVSLAGSLMFGVHLLAGPVCAGFSNVFGLRPVTITGCIICCFGVGITYFATGYWYLYFTYGVLGGVGLGLVYMNSLVITSVYFTTLMPVAIAIVVCGTGAGTVVFALFGSFLLRVTNWQTSFLVQAILAGSMGVAAISFKPLKPIRVKLTSTSPKSIDSIKKKEEEISATTTKKAAVFIRRASADSARTIHSLVWENILEQAVMTEFKRQQCCKGQCIKCRKRRRKVPKEGSVLVLSEIKDATPRKSYIEASHEERLSRPSIETQGLITRENSVESRRNFYTRVDFEEKPKGKTCEPLKKTLVGMLDCHLLSSLAFSLFTISGALQVASLLVVFIYEKDRTTELGFTEEMSVYFIVTLGGANMFWRLLLGGLATIPKINYTALAVSGIVIGGVATVFSGFIANIYYQFTFCILFSLAMASFAVFRLVILLDLVEITQVMNATGINLLFMGSLSIVFPPIFGWIVTATTNYNVIFYITGFLLTVSGLMLINLKQLRRKEIEKLNRRMMYQQ